MKHCRYPLFPLPFVAKALALYCVFPLRLRLKHRLCLAVPPPQARRPRAASACSWWPYSCNPYGEPLAAAVGSHGVFVPQVAQAIFLALWATVFVQSWKRREQECQFEWSAALDPFVFCISLKLLAHTRLFSL